MKGQVSRGSAGEYQADDPAGVARLTGEYQADELAVVARLSSVEEEACVQPVQNLGANTCAQRRSFGHG